MDAKIPILSALNNHFGVAVNGSNGLFSAGADRRVVFLCGLFHTIGFRPSPSPSASLYKYVFSSDGRGSNDLPAREEVNSQKLRNISQHGSYRGNENL